MTRQRLPDTRQSITHKIVINAPNRRVKLFLTIGFYPDGTPGEMFIHADNEEPELRGTLRCTCIGFSMALQTGTEIHQIADKLSFMRFEPSGFTGNPAIPHVLSIADYIGRFLKLTFPRSGSVLETTPDRKEVTGPQKEE